MHGGTALTVEAHVFVSEVRMHVSVHSVKLDRSIHVAPAYRYRLLDPSGETLLETGLISPTHAEASEIVEVLTGHRPENDYRFELLETDWYDGFVPRASPGVDNSFIFTASDKR